MADPHAQIADMVESAFAVAEDREPLSAESLRALLRPPTGAPALKVLATREDADAAVAAAIAAMPVPEAWGFDIDSMNREFALVLMGSKAVIVREMPQAKVEDRVRILSIEAFRAYFSNRRTQVVDSDGKIRVTTWANCWLGHCDRRQFDGIEFHPDPANAGGTENYLNLWRGFSVEPKADAGRYDIFRDHLLTNVCRGDADLFRWLFGWFAHLVQRPRERVGTALVFRGRMGTGKTKIGEVIGSLIADHYFLVDDPRYITGQFNAHMASCLLMQAEEAVWAGDKAAEGRLKSLITSSMQMIEAKGVDPVRVENYLRLIMTSNEDWVVPAGKEERRFAVFTIGDHARENHGYFQDMQEELDAGGYQALLADLLAFDLSTVNLRQIPKTEALLEQKIRSLKHVERWWLDCLHRGSIYRGGADWQTEVPKPHVVAEYLADGDRTGVRHRAGETELGISIRKLVPALMEGRKQIRVDDGDFKRVRTWCFPSLDECRAAFEELVGQTITWPRDERDGEGASDGP